MTVAQSLAAVPTADDLPLVMNVYPVEAGGIRWFADETSDLVRWDFRGKAPRRWYERGLARLKLERDRGCRIAVDLAHETRACLLISHDPYATYPCARRNRSRRRRVPHVAWSFNFPRLPGGLRRRRMAEAFRDVDRFMVFSTMERELYADHFDLPIDRFRMNHWAMGPLSPEPADRPLIEGEYLSAVGGNSRDYRTLFEAIRMSPGVKLVVVARPDNVRGLSIPCNVEIRTGVPFDQTMNIVKHSRATIIPLVGSEVPCGQVTIVVAMQLGVPSIVTRSTGLDDYIIPEVNALTYSAGRPDELASAIRRIWEDADLRSAIRASARRFFEEHCDERFARQSLIETLHDFRVLHRT